MNEAERQARWRAEIAALARLKSIVNDLAAVDPLAFADFGEYRCGVCRGVTVEYHMFDDEDAGPTVTVSHKRGRHLEVHIVHKQLCPWVRAVGAWAPAPNGASFWFADEADKEDGMVHKDGSLYWKAWLQDRGGCFDLPMWFDTKDDAMGYISTIPAGLQP